MALLADLCGNICWLCLYPPKGSSLLNRFLVRLLPVESRLERRRERLLGIDTYGPIPVNADTGVGGDAERYSPTNYFILRRIFDHLRLCGDDVFVDLGCGKGLVVLYAARRGCRKAIGIELSPELAETARENARCADAATPVEIVEGDAATCDLSEGTVFYMFNPFGAATMQLMLRNLELSLLSNPRTIRIVYMCTPHDSLIDALDWLEADDTVKRTHLFKIWRSRNPRLSPGCAEGGEESRARKV
jgi:precorrin-6B methylase 2